MSDDQHNKPEGPAPEVLKPAESSDTPLADSIKTEEPAKPATPMKRTAYRPSHKATFIGLTVVAVILIVNAVIITLVIRNGASAEDSQAAKGVTISSSVLDGLGVSRNAVGNADTELTIGPNTQFGGKVVMSKDLNIGGQLMLNGKFNVGDAAIRNLQAGETAVEKLNVNADATVSSLNLRKDLKVAGTTTMQGALTVNQLTTVNNNMNIAGNLSVGGSLIVRNFQVGNLTVAGHLISSGATPGVSGGGGIGPAGTVSISGNDTSGTVVVNTGVGAGGGLLASVSFREKYASTPHVVVTPVGRSLATLYINRTTAGFTISCDGALPAGSWAFDYIVAQ